MCFVLIKSMSECSIDLSQKLKNIWKLTLASHVGVLTLRHVNRKGVGCSGCLRNATCNMTGEREREKNNQCAFLLFSTQV